VQELHDPSAYFRSLKQENPTEEFWAGFWPSVRSGIREAELRRLPALTPTGALLLGSSAGVMVAAAVLVLGFLVLPAMRNAPAPVATPLAALPASAPGGEENAPPPVLEDLDSPSARVYTFHVGERADATDVILIVDERIDL